MFVDVHAHLTHEYFNDDLDEVVKQAQKNKVIIICAGSGLKDNQQVLGLSEKYDNVKASLGLYPWDAVSLTDGEVDFLIDNIKSNAKRLVCIGEAGLDYHWGQGKDDLEKQEWVFSQMLNLGADIKKPVLIHCRKAEYDVLELLKLFNKGVQIIHSYTGPMKLVPHFLDLGCYFSIPSAIINNKTFKRLAKKVPINQMLTETDSPFLSPERGARNEPLNVINGVKKIAEIKGMKPSDIEKQLFNNAQDLFGELK